MTKNIQEIISGAVGGKVGVSLIRDPASGDVRYSVCYESRATFWQSKHRFQEIEHAQAAALALGDFLGARIAL
ncbi:hypothetical protein [Bradyrhizobium sp. USDA 4504]